MAENFANNAYSYLQAPITAGETTLTVLNAGAFPAVNFRIIVDNEFMLVTGKSGNQFTVTRGIESTQATSHAAGADVVHVITAGALTDFLNTAGGYGLQSGEGEAAGAAADRAGIVSVAPGTTSIDVSTNPLDFDLPVELKGENRNSILALDNDAASGTKTAMSFAAGATLTDLNIVYTSNAGLTALGVTWNTDNLKIKNCLFNGSTLESGGSRNHTIHMIQAHSSGTQNGLTLDEVEITGVSYPILKSNTTVSTQNRIKVRNSYFHDNYGVDMVFNSPAAGSKMNDILVLGNTFGANLAGDISGFSHRISMAGHVENFRVIGNHAEGEGNELWRAEEAAKAGIVLGNTAQIGERHGIEVTDNNVGGVAYTPELLAIAENILRGTKASGSRGVHLVHDASTLPPLVKSTLHHNILSGWETGIRLARKSHMLDLDNNLVNDSTTGVLAQEPTVMLKETLLVDCPTGISAGSGGMFGRTHFRATSSETPLIATPVSAGGHKGSMLGWTWESGIFDLENATPVVIPIMLAGNVFNGEIKIHLSRGTTQYSILIATVDYDGTTLTTTEKRRYQSGSVVINSTSLSIVSSNLCVRLSNGAGSIQTGCRLQVAFDGLHVWN